MPRITGYCSYGILKGQMMQRYARMFLAHKASCRENHLPMLLYGQDSSLDQEPLTRF